MTDLALVRRARATIDPLACAYQLDWGPCRGKIVSRYADRQCVDGALVELPNGETCLLLPGTGGGKLNPPNNLLWDWVRNLWSQVPYHHVAQNLVDVPAQGASKDLLWCRGFLEAADRLDDWLNHARLTTGAKIDWSAGHSQGGAILQILAWSRTDLGECHAVGSAASCFSGPQPRPGLHVWLSSDDPVGEVPVGASHVGQVHRLGPIGGTVVQRHALTGYAKRFDQLLGA